MSKKNIYDKFRNNGFTEVKCDKLLYEKILSLIEESRIFFDLPIDLKRNFYLKNNISGYKELGIEYSDKNKRPDLKESFSFRKTEVNLLKIKK